MGFLNKLTVQKRLALLMAVPLIFLSLILSTESHDRYLDLNKAKTTLNIAGIADLSAQIAHQLQNERTLTANFLAGGAQRGELDSARGGTDARVAALKDFLAETGAHQELQRLKSQVDKTVSSLGRLSDTRRRVDAKSIGGGEAFTAYAEILAEVRTTVRVVSQVIPSQELMRLIAAHYNFLEFIMRLHGERLLLTNTFAYNEFAPLSFMRFAESLAEQGIYLESFQTLAAPDISNYLQEQMSDPSVDQVKKLRQVAIDHRFGGGFNVDPARWHTSISGMIEKMNQVESRIVQNYRDAGEQYKSDIQWQLLFKFGTGFVVWWTTAIAAVLVSISLVRSLTAISTDIGDGTVQVTTASHQLAATSQSVADSSSNQAAAIEQTSASMEEMTAMINRDADNALQADALMREANDVLGRADGSMKNLTVSMDEINSASVETQKIVKTIDEIAFQTNLLALNAAVEAARAGEAGAGFAVVADEVRNLAMRAAEAAQNTSTLIDGTVQKVKGGAELVTETGESFTQAREAVQKIAVLLAEIASASREEADAAKQVNGAISHIDSATQDNAAAAEETASAAEELSGQAESIQVRIVDLMAMVGKEFNYEKLERSLKRPHSPQPHKERGSRPAISAPKKPAPKKPAPKEITQESETFEDF